MHLFILQHVLVFCKVHGRPAAVVVSEGGGVWIQGGGGVCGGYLHREVANGEARQHVSHAISLHSLVAQLVECSPTLQIMGSNLSQGSSSLFIGKKELSWV